MKKRSNKIKNSAKNSAAQRTTSSPMPQPLETQDTLEHVDLTDKADKVDPPVFLISSAVTDKYTILMQIGRGAQGNIYKARDRKTGELVAIKQLRIDQVENWKAYDLFEREANVLSQLNIPGVAKFYEAMSCLDDDPPCAYIVQELIEGVSLESHLRSGKRWTLAKSFEISIQILDILEKLHHSDPPVIHRDLKPSNIMICQKNGADQVYLIDFGAVANPIVQGGGSTVAGTYGYMPSEQLMGKPGPESDIYALAVTIVYMLSGVSPADMDLLEFRLVIEPHLQAFPEVIMHVLGRMLAPSAKDRLTDYQEIRRYFNNFIHSDFTENDLHSDAFYASKDYVRQIKSVRTLWDNGNLKLWSALPSQIPRNVPRELIKIEDAELCSHRSIMRASAELRIGDYRDVFRYFYKILFIIFTSMIGLAFFVLTIGIFVLLIYFYVKDKLDFFSVEGASATMGLVIGIGISGLFAFFWFYLFKNVWKDLWMENQKLYDKRANDILKAHRYTKKSVYKMRNLLMNSGQKTIATIVSIRYVPNNGKPGETYNYIGIAAQNGECVYIHTVPSFIVTYKFNPPNDSLSEELVHRTTIHRSSDSKLHLGDPLPILYKVDAIDKQKVYSMPFPFAMCDVENYEDLICYTVNGSICDMN